MPRHCRSDPMFRYRRHEDAIIVLAVLWYISYRLSLRDLVERLADSCRVGLPPTGESRLSTAHHNHSTLNLSSSRSRHIPPN